MRIPSGVTDHVIYFVAVDAIDLKTRETGLTSFTIYYDKDGSGTPGAGQMPSIAAPGVTQLDATNMPGIYKLSLNESSLVTVDTGADSEELVLHITTSGVDAGKMAPVTRVVEIYRSKITLGEALTVSSGAASSVTTVGTCTTNTDMRGTDSAATAIALATVDTNVDSILVDTGTDGVVLSSATQQAIAASLLDLVDGVESGVTLRQSIRAMAAVLAGTATGGPTSSSYKAINNSSTARVVSVADANGDRSAVSLSL